jgi:hypothetical protein
MLPRAVPRHRAKIGPARHFGLISRRKEHIMNNTIMEDRMKLIRRCDRFEPPDPGKKGTAAGHIGLSHLHFTCICRGGDDQAVR